MKVLHLLLKLLSGSLQDHKRAIIIGEKTFGKGSVQAVLPIDNERTENIKLTIAKYYLPSGRTIQAVRLLLILLRMLEKLHKLKIMLLK